MIFLPNFAAECGTLRHSAKINIIFHIIKRIMKNMMKFWAQELRWRGRSPREKCIIVWFGVSLAAVPLAALWWLAAPVLANLWMATRAVMRIGGVEE